MFWWFVLFTVLIYGMYLLIRLFMRRTVVRDYQVGLLYKNGRLEQQLGAGSYWLNPLSSAITVVDTRRVTTVVAGQEVTTQDNIGLKLSASVSYQVSDAEKALHSVENYSFELYTLVQLAIREEVSGQPIDALLENRQGLGDALTERVTPQATELGLKLHSVQIRDFMFSGDLKRSFNEVLRARKEGEAKLERARGETAALRNLANAAKMLDDNPNLISLRLLQAIENSKGNNFMLDSKMLETKDKS